jgi:hypothetical protein
MVPLLTALAVVAYGIAAYLLWADRSWRPLLVLLAGSCATLLQPLWARIFGSTPNMPGNIINIGQVVSFPFWTVVGGGVLLALPALIVMYGLRRGWWVQHYVVDWGFFLLFVFFFMIVGAAELRNSVRIFAGPMLGSQLDLWEALFQAVLLAGVSYGLLYSFVATRHYALQIALVPMLVSGAATALLLYGILCSPFWVARLLHQTDRIQLVGAVISVFLVLWAVHLLASGLHAGRHQRLQWR